MTNFIFENTVYRLENAVFSTTLPDKKTAKLSTFSAMGQI
jgi:hypothetical protein